VEEREQRQRQWQPLSEWLVLLQLQRLSAAAVSSCLHQAFSNECSHRQSTAAAMAAQWGSRRVK
jgi:hypothetical protein